ncbi:MAG: hypothetical protein PHE54_03005 [Bacilli bacterium]|nr:hypothetical protein [Bacilli bacterium]
MNMNNTKIDLMTLEEAIIIITEKLSFFTPKEKASFCYAADHIARSSQNSELKHMIDSLLIRHNSRRERIIASYQRRLQDMKCLPKKEEYLAIIKNAKSLIAADRLYEEAVTKNLIGHSIMTIEKLPNITDANRDFYIKQLIENNDRSNATIYFELAMQENQTNVGKMKGALQALIMGTSYLTPDDKANLLKKVRKVKNVSMTRELYNKILEKGHFICISSNDTEFEKYKNDILLNMCSHKNINSYQLLIAIVWLHGSLSKSIADQTEELLNHLSNFAIISERELFYYVNLLLSTVNVSSNENGINYDAEHFVGIGTIDGFDEFDIEDNVR